jgi:hypothetical protein
MQTKTSECSGTSTASAGAAPQTCPCEIPTFCRTRFYTGKLLTEGDLNRDQRYMIDKLRLHYVALHGWGVVCGLMVRPHPECPDRFVVTPGFAVDDCGREIRLLQECEVHFPKPPEPVVDPCPSDDEDDEDEDKQERASAERSEEPRSRTYYVCIRYQECQEDFMPVVFDECCSKTTQANRICECAVIDVLTEPPACLPEIRDRRRCHEEHCHELWERIPKECPPLGRSCCIPLAVIREYVYCESLLEEMIDNSIRPVMPSAWRLEELIHCVMDHLPKSPPRLTHITRFNWDHNGEYRSREFLRDFVGTHEYPRGFEIEFDARVHPRGLSPSTFQAMIVRETPGTHEPRHVEIAPARVVRREDGHACILHIDPEYAHRHLHEHNFDVFITLQCDKVIDERGLAVDGNLLATRLEDEDRDYVLKFPTGDGVPGGLFESWIRVRREH